MHDCECFFLSICQVQILIGLSSQNRFFPVVLFVWFFQEQIQDFSGGGGGTTSAEGASFLRGLGHASLKYFEKETQKGEKGRGGGEAHTGPPGSLGSATVFLMRSSVFDGVCMARFLKSFVQFICLGVLHGSG